MNNQCQIYIDGRYEANFQPFSDCEPMEFSDNDLVKIKNWMADKLCAFSSPARAYILDHGADKAILFEERN